MYLVAAGAEGISIDHDAAALSPHTLVRQLNHIRLHETQMRREEERREQVIEERERTGENVTREEKRKNLGDNGDPSDTPLK